MYITIISFIIWGFFNFYMIEFRGEISPINVIVFLYIFAFSFMSLYRLFSQETLLLNFKEKVINITAGVAQAVVYILYFYLLFLFPSDSILIVVFYNLFGLVLVLFDAWLFQTKNDKIEYGILLAVLFLSLFLVIKTQLILGRTIENISFHSLYGFVPALFAALVGILYKYSSNFKSTTLLSLVHSNFQLLFYRSMGGLGVSFFVYLCFLYFTQVPFEIKYVEVKLGLLYSLFPFLISHMLYSISLYKKASILVLSVFMNLSPVITIASMYYFSDIIYELDSIVLISIVLILVLSTVLSVYHKNKEKLT